MLRALLYGGAQLHHQHRNNSNEQEGRCTGSIILLLKALSRFHDKFVAQAKVLVDLDVDIVARATLVSVVNTAGGDPDNPTVVETAAAYQKTLATYFVLGAAGHYKDYMKELRNAMLEGRNNYPVTLTAAYHILRERPQDYVPTTERAQGVAFVTAGGGVRGGGAGPPVPGDNGVLHDHITCHTCNLLGHYANHCPTAGAEGKVGYVFIQGLFPDGSAVIRRTWILLDN